MSRTGQIKKCYQQRPDGPAYTWADVIARTGATMETARKRCRVWANDRTRSEEYLFAPAWVNGLQLHQQRPGGPAYTREDVIARTGIDQDAARCRCYRWKTEVNLTEDWLFAPPRYEGVSADRLTNLRKMAGPGTWERQNL